jgi:hypothetical protein
MATPEAAKPNLLVAPVAAQGPASAQTTLVPSSTSHRQGAVHLVLAAAKWATLVLAILLSLSAAALPLTGVGGGFLAYGVAGLAMIVGLVAIGLSLVSRRSMLESAVVCLFLAVAGLLFSINIAVSASKSDAAADVMAKAKAQEDQVRQEREKGEAAQKSAAEMLKKAEEAPAKAEAFYKMAKNARDLAEGAEKRTADLLAKAEAQQEKNALDRKKIADEQAKLEMAQGELRIVQKDIAEKKLELVELKKEMDAAKKNADDDLAALKREIDADKKKAEDKAKEAKNLLKKIEDTLKGAALQLKDKNPAVRIKTANAIAKLPQFPEAREFLAEPLVEAMLDPMPDVRDSASEALAKVDPAIQPHVLTIILGKDKRGAGKQLEGLGKEARFAMPALLHCYHSNYGAEDLSPDQRPLIRAIWLDTLVRVAPNAKRVADIVLAEVANNRDRFHFAREKAISLLDSVGADKKDKVKALITVFGDGVLAVTAITAVERIGAPDAEAAIPALKKLKSSSDDAVRSAATKALSAIEKAK